MVRVKGAEWPFKLGRVITSMAVAAVAVQDSVVLYLFMAVP